MISCLQTMDRAPKTWWPGAMCVALAAVLTAGCGGQDAPKQPTHPRDPSTVELDSRIEELLALDHEWDEEIAAMTSEECMWLARETMRLRDRGKDPHARPSVQEDRIIKQFRPLYVLHQVLGKRLYEVEQEKLKREETAGQPAPLVQARALGYDVLTYPYVDGSTSTRPLARVVACRLLDVPYLWMAKPGFPDYYYSRVSADSPTLEFHFATRELEAATQPREHYRTGHMINNTVVNHSGTHGAYVSLITGDVDLILVARSPSPDEIEQAREKGVTLDVRPVALDAFVFIVHSLNPVEGLSTEHIRDIYAARIRYWKYVGGPFTQINAYQRERNSGSQELMLNLVMKDRPMEAGGLEWQRQMIVSGMGGPFNRLIKDENGLAYSVYYYEHFMAVSAFTKVIAVDGVRPTRETIANRTYPYVTEVYVVVRDNLPAEHGARKLRDWLLTDEGQSVVAESGYVPFHAQ